MKNPRCEPRVHESAYCMKTTCGDVSHVLVFVIEKGPNGTQIASSVSLSYHVCFEERTHDEVEELLVSVS